METTLDFNGPESIALGKKLWGNAKVPEDERIPIWLDCDTGHDDAFAILIAAHCPRIRLLGISTVHGNASLDNTTRNTLSVLEAIGRRDIPVYPGAAKPFCRDPAHAESIHGETGLDGTTVLPKPISKPSTHPHGTIAAIYDALWSCKSNSAWLITTGSLTNAALLFNLYPQLAEHVAGVSIMGGAVGNCFTEAPMGKITTRIELKKAIWKKYPNGLPLPEGSGDDLVQQVRDMDIIQDAQNITDDEIRAFIIQSRDNFGNWSPWAEFNIFVDPESSQAMLSHPVLGPKTTLITLDLTHQVLGTTPVLDLIKFGRKPGIVHGTTPSTSPASSLVRQLFHEIITFFAAAYAEQFAMHSGPPLHDPLTLAAILAPLIFNDNGGERYSVNVAREEEDDRDKSYEERVEKNSVGRNSNQTGRIVVKLVEKGQSGLRIPRAMDVGVFWNFVEMGLESAERSAKLQNGEK